MQSSARNRLAALLKVPIQSARECGDPPAGASVTDLYRRSVVLDERVAAKADHGVGLLMVAPEEADCSERAGGHERRGRDLRQLRAHDRADVRHLAQVGAQ